MGEGRRAGAEGTSGNQIQEEVEGGSDVYASGVEAGTVRALLRKAAMNWAVGSLDIRTALTGGPIETTPLGGGRWTLEVERSWTRTSQGQGSGALR